MEKWVEVLVETLRDGLKMLPFLFAAYLLIEYIEQYHSAKLQKALAGNSRYGFAVGGALGLVPQCGFSAMAADLYAAHVITPGTLLAVFLSTSDEMLPIFIAEQVPWQTVVAVLAFKVLFALAVGFAVDAVMRLAHKQPQALTIHELCEDANCYCEEHCAGEDPGEHHAHDEGECHHEHGSGSIAMSALTHTLQVTVVIFLVSLVLDAVLALVGEEFIEQFLAANSWVAVLASATVGLIPNCAASVALAQLFVDGVLGTGPAMAGLLVSAGIGLLVLVRTNKHRPAENALIIAGLWVIGVVAGLALNALGVVF